MPVRLDVNGTSHEVNADPASPLLWVLRDHLKLVGTKYGCGIGQCAACTVMIDGTPTWSCQITAGDAQAVKITTIEGLADGEELNAVQQAWIEEDVAQCGYCQAGQIVTATDLLRRNPSPSDAEIDEAMQRHLCRCGTYIRIRKAIRTAVGKIAQGARL
jgi:aerobic-type carbon monoxide dehydrogenase small subunit (CoxS/CutS family)